MGKIAKTDLSPLYSSASQQVKDSGDRAACSVIAVSILCGVSVEEATKALEVAGRKKGEGAWDETIEAALAQFGVEVEKFDYMKRQEVIAAYPGAGPGLKNMTAHHPVRYAAKWKELGLTDGLMFTRGHVIALKDGAAHCFQAQTMKRLVGLWIVRSAPESAGEAPEAPAAVEAPATIEEAPEAPAYDPEEPSDAIRAAAQAAIQRAVEAEEKRLDGMTRNILRTECKKAGVKNYANMGKAEMITAILVARFPN